VAGGPKGHKQVDKLSSMGYYRIMNEKEIKEDLDLLKRWELIDMIVDMEKTILKYEDKARYNAKQGKADA